MAANKIMICAGVITLIQAVGQIVFCSLGLAQYFCLIDFLRDLPMLLYIRIMYFHKPGPCGTSINIGNAIEGIANQAFVLLTQEPLPAFRTFIINCTSLGIAGLWLPASILIIMGGAKNTPSKCVRWPWVLVSVAACGVDLVAVVMYANDSFYTRTLAEIMDFVGGTASGIGSANLDTTWASWIMVIVYSRFVILFVINVLLVLTVVVDCNSPIRPITTGTQVEAPVTRTQDTSTSDKSEDEESTTGDTRPLTLLPRPGLSRSFRRMKAFLFGKLTSAPAPVARSTSNADSYVASVDRSPKPLGAEKRSVNFPENLLSLPQRLENMIAAQQRRLEGAVDTAGPRGNSPPVATQSLPQLPLSETDHAAGLSRRGTATELARQLPWAYIPAPATRDRDEALPPVPLPDYTAIQPNRKASVHRAASSLSSLVQHRRDLATLQSRPTITESDVLY